MNMRVKVNERTEFTGQASFLRCSFSHNVSSSPPIINMFPAKTPRLTDEQSEINQSYKQHVVDRTRRMGSSPKEFKKFGFWSRINSSSTTIRVCSAASDVLRFEQNDCDKLRVAERHQQETGDER
uniref:Uncharacterized protein n=1 Tax=Onchocerca volvulus TaxID=6282 RepID=A0A8R1TP98_ONCVO